MNHTNATAQTISIPAWDSLQRAPGEARVLGRFERVVDLLLGDDILALATPDVGCGPFHLVVDALPAAPLPDRVAVRVLPDVVQVGPWRFALPAELPLWNPRPPWGQLALIPARLAALREVVSAAACAGSVSPLAQALYNGAHTDGGELQKAHAKSQSRQEIFTQTHFIRKTAQQLHAEILKDLCGSAALREVSHKPPTLDAAVAALAGWGPGLTPSGDDFLAGLMLALWARQGEAARPLCARIAAAAAPRTTRLSGAFLRAAAEGLADQRWHTLLHALAGSSDGALETAAQAVLAFGASSGLDMLTGFLWGNLTTDDGRRTTSR